MICHVCTEPRCNTYNFLWLRNHHTIYSTACISVCMYNVAYIPPGEEIMIDDVL